MCRFDGRCRGLARGAVVSRRLGVKAASWREKRPNSIPKPVAAKMLLKYDELTNREGAC